MSLYQGKVINLILLERFGPIVADIGEIIFQSPSSFFRIRKLTVHPLLKVKEALSILIKFNLASFKVHNNGTTAIYSLRIENIFLILRYPTFINLIKKKMDKESEMLVEELSYKGCCIASHLIIKIALRSNESKIKQIRDAFVALATANYFKRLPTFNKKQEDNFLIPNLDTQQLFLIMNGSNESPVDNGIYWTINPDRFNQDLRDQLIVNAVANKFDDNASELMKIFLQQMYIRSAPWVPNSNPIPILEVKEIIEKQNTHPQLIEFFDQYVTVLEEDTSNIIKKVGEESVVLVMKEIFTQLTWETVEHMVNEKFDRKASRIFRLIKSQSYIETGNIQNLVMIPAKEAKQISYKLLEEHFLLLKELKRSIPGAGPNKSFSLFYIQLTQIVRTMLELCYKTLFNHMTRRHHEKFLNKRVIDKKKRVDTISLGMRVQGAPSEQLVDIEEMITPSENETLEIIGKMMKKISTIELEIDDTIFLLEMYLVYESL